MFDTQEIAILPRSGALADRPAAIASLLKQADRLIADAIELVMRGGLTALTGLPAEMVLTTEAGRTWSDARMIVRAAEVFRHMPLLLHLFRRGAVSWSQVRGIVCAVSRVRVADHEDIDRLIAERAPSLADCEAEALVELVDREVAARRPDLVEAREDRSVRNNALWFQGTVDGGADFGGHADAQATATIVEALEYLADDPVHAGDPDAPTRSEQHLEAFVRMAETVLCGASGGVSKPRPSLYATFDIAGLNDAAHKQGIELFTALAGRPVTLTNVSRDTLLCDSSVVPVVFSGPRVIAIGSAAHTFSDKVKRAIKVRDRRCRFCGSAAAAWCDAHHMVPGLGNTADHGCLLCRRCHRRVHRYGWKTRMRADGSIEFSRGRRRFVSPPP